MPSCEACDVCTAVDHGNATCWHCVAHWTWMRPEERRDLVRTLIDRLPELPAGPVDVLQFVARLDAASGRDPEPARWCAVWAREIADRCSRQWWRTWLDLWEFVGGMYAAVTAPVGPTTDDSYEDDAVSPISEAIPGDSTELEPSSAALDNSLPPTGNADGDTEGRDREDRA